MPDTSSTSAYTSAGWLHEDTENFGQSVFGKRRFCSNSTLVCGGGGVTGSMAEDGVQEVVEGKARVLLPKSVFYNPVQEFNRDLTTCIIAQFAEEYLAEQAQQQSDSNSKAKNKKKRESGADTEQEQSDASSKGHQMGEKNDQNNCSEDRKGIRIFEGLSASGLRAIRFGLEVPGVKEVIANDFDWKAVEFIEKNIIRNGLTDLVKSSHGDASMVMYQNKDYAKRFDVIDLDPYGSASQFLDAAVQAVCDGGLLCIRMQLCCVAMQARRALQSTGLCLCVPSSAMRWR